MSETLKINLTKVGAMLVIAVTLVSIVGGAMIAHNNARDAKAQATDNAKAIQKLELDYAQFKGIMDERTRTTLNRVNDIWEYIQTLEIDHAEGS